ncbi:stalk domain-containing protein [Paenibacillus ihbetae]|nr:stalk domain-containing protein [Paenibacillus ihbetae]
MMKLKKSILTMAVLGMTLSGAAGVYAGANLQKITAYLNHSIGIQVDGKVYDSSKTMTPITYNNTTYLPVRAIAEVLDVPVRYDAANRQVVIGTGTDQGQSNELVPLKYSEAQLREIRKAFAKFEGFEAAYAPDRMVKGDVYRKTGASEDGVNIMFEHMTVNISPRDYSYGYNSKPVTLSNGTKAKWYTPDDTAMLGFQLDDRFVTLSSPDHSLSPSQLEQIAVHVTKMK